MNRSCRWLVMMVKVPKAGRVKTRLARDIGAVQATRVYRQVLSSLARRLDQPRRWRLVLAVDPDGESASNCFPHYLTRFGQGRGDLGERMHRVMIEMPPGPVVIIGSDMPLANRRHIAAAFDALEAHDAVIGPSPDGGYWLIGLRRRPSVPSVFEDVRWSTANALRDTRDNMQGLSVAEVEMLDDIDDGGDLDRASRCCGRLILPPATQSLG